MTPRVALPPSSDPVPAPAGFPDADELAALRAWYAGMTVRQAVERYLPDRLGERRSARGVIGAIRRRLVRVARQAGRPDLAEQLGHDDSERMQMANAAADAIGQLRHARPPVPQIGDDVGLWLPARAVVALRAHGIATLADLTVRIPRRRQWWRAIAGLGVASARRIEAFFPRIPI